MVGRAALTTGLLLVAAAGAGAWKVHAFARANRELDIRARRCATLLAETARAAREARAHSPRPGSPAPSFTVLGLDGGTLVFRGAAEPGPVRLIFADAASSGAEPWLALIRSYRASRVHEPQAKVLILAAAGPERTREALRGVVPPWPVGVHAAEAYAAYGVLDGAAVVMVENGLVAGRRTLPIRDDELPLP
jgi:hypothetical protein